MSVVWFGQKEEFTWLVYGYSKFGNKWNLILNNYSENFDKSRTVASLCTQYNRLKKQSEKLIYYQNKAKLLK